MNTPIVDFIRKYKEADPARFHMPGHKGRAFLGYEANDITEIDGADVLYCANGIIDQSEKNASKLFGSARTFYSAEGSTQVIKAMLALSVYDNEGRTEGERPVILAARNVHRAFIHACALLDIDARFVYPKENGHICRCVITPDILKKALEALPKKPAAVYLTSPDYLGNMLDIKTLSEECKKYNVPLIVDNAHGAYLAFCSPSLHPLSLGADMCCDSAHKTLPALTGAAYLHISENAPKSFTENARARLALFSSTSPSYLILSSLDHCNKYISEGYKEKLQTFTAKLTKLKTELSEAGFKIEGDEPLKLTLRVIDSGIDGNTLSDSLRKKGIQCEYCDREYIVFMLTPENTENELQRLKNALLGLPKEIFSATSNRLVKQFACSEKTVCSIREAIFAPHETVPVEKAIGRICASPTVSCPPAIPIAVSGELITKESAELFEYYGVKFIDVIK